MITRNLKKNEYFNVIKKLTFIFRQHRRKYTQVKIDKWNSRVLNNYTISIINSSFLISIYTTRLLRGRTIECNKDLSDESQWRKIRTNIKFEFHVNFSNPRRCFDKTVTWENPAFRDSTTGKFPWGKKKRVMERKGKLRDSFSRFTSNIENNFHLVRDEVRKDGRERHESGWSSVKVIASLHATTWWTDKVLDLDHDATWRWLCFYLLRLELNYAGHSRPTVGRNLGNVLVATDITKNLSRKFLRVWSFEIFHGIIVEPPWSLFSLFFVLEFR